MSVQTETTETLVLVLEAEPVPFPADLDAYEEHVEAVAGEVECFPVEFAPLTSDDAAKAAKRRAYWLGIATDMARPFDEEVARLRGEAKRFLDEASRLELERDAAAKPYRRKANWYEAPLEAFMRAVNAANKDIKSWPTPFGKLSVTKQQPEWNYGDDKALAQWLQTNAPDYIKPTANKAELKKGVKVRKDGTVVLVASGEIVPGITVTERQAKFEIE